MANKQPVGFGRPDVHASGAVVVKLPDKPEIKRFACFCKKPDNQHDTKLEFYASALGNEQKPTEVFDLGLDFVMKLDSKTNTFQVTRKADKAKCTVTFYKAPTTKDVPKLLAQFSDAMQYCAESMKDAQVASLDCDIPTDDPTLGVQGGADTVSGAAKGSGRSVAHGKHDPGEDESPGRKGAGRGGGGKDEEVDELKPGLFEIIQHVDKDPKGRKISWRNETRDKQFTIKYKFKEPGKLVFADGAKKVEADTYEYKVYPGAHVEGAQGEWNGQTREIRSGKPDKEWQQREAKRLAAVLDEDTKAVVALVKKAGKKKVTAEDIAQLCYKERRQFVDLTFPPNQSSILQGHESGIKQQTWQCPTQWLDEQADPALFVNKIEPEDIDQGSLGDCYLLSAISCLAEFPHIIYGIFDESQDSAIGCYRVSVCKHGWWQNIVLDHYFPADGSGPVFARNKEEPNELWVALCEKAYAKLHGSYGSIRSGSGGQALSDFTGCPYENFDADEMTEELYATLKENDAVDYIQMVSTPGKDTSDYAGGAKNGGEVDMSAKYEKVGLACGHAYSMISVQEYKGAKLCKIRNPWGNGKEWKGDWSDSDKKNWTADAKKALGYVDEDDGTFWMTWKDVRKWFTSATCCYVTQWDQYRMAAALGKGVADLAMKIECSEDTEAWVGVQQQDTRGLDKTQKAAMKYLHLSINVLEDAGGAMKGVCTPVPKNGRDHYKLVKMEKGKTYYMFAQASSEEDRCFTYALLPEVPTALKVTFLTPKGAGKMYKPVTDFSPADYDGCEAVYQIKGIFSTNGRIVERVGTAVDQSIGKRVLTAEEKKIHKNPKGGKGLGAYSSVPIEITAVAGKSLPVMDADGSCDPYLEIKLKAQDAKGNVVNMHPRPQTQYTQCAENTLNPKWGSTHPFSCVGEDVIFVTCFDRDTKGKDYMGEFQIPLTDLDIAPGKAVTKSYKLRGDINHGGQQKNRGAATGEIELAIKVLA